VVIREAQIETLRRSTLRAFENEMVEHLARFSPPLFKAAGAEQLREVIRWGMKRAVGYGITLRGPVRLYLELMLLFGSQFDTDPQYPWAAEVLKDQEIPSQMQRADHLYRSTLEFRERVGGPHDAYTLQALRRIPAVAQQELAVSSANLVEDLMAEVARIYPEKAAYLGEKGMTALIDEGITTAAGLGFSSVRAITLSVVLMFAFGHGCFEDPLYPWIGKTAVNSAIAAPDARAKRLESKALTWLEHVLAYFDGSAAA
jgi:hypothetical protein